MQVFYEKEINSINKLMCLIMQETEVLKDTPLFIGMLND